MNVFQLSANTNRTKEQGELWFTKSAFPFSCRFDLMKYCCMWNFKDRPAYSAVIKLLESYIHLADTKPLRATQHMDISEYSRKAGIPPWSLSATQGWILSWQFREGGRSFTLLFWPQRLSNLSFVKASPINIPSSSRTPAIQPQFTNTELIHDESEDVVIIPPRDFDTLDPLQDPKLSLPRSLSPDWLRVQPISFSTLSGRWYLRTTGSFRNSQSNSLPLQAFWHILCAFLVSTLPASLVVDLLHCLVWIFWPDCGSCLLFWITLSACWFLYCFFEPVSKDSYAW